MKSLCAVLFVVILVFAFTEESDAQPFGGPPGGEGRGRGPERLERFRKMRLIEVLKLNEEESVRFFTKQNAHEDKIQNLTKQRNEILDDMQQGLDDKGENKEIQKLSDQILDIDQKIFTERQRFQQEVRGLLSAGQFARMLIFERNFGRQVRDAMDELRRDRRPNRPD